MAQNDAVVLAEGVAGGDDIIELAVALLVDQETTGLAGDAYVEIAHPVYGEVRIRASRA